MKTSLFFLLALLLAALTTTPAQAQTNEGSAVRTYVGYVGLINASSKVDQSGPALMLSFPGISSKLRLFGGGSSVQNGLFGGLEYSSLISDPDAPFRARITGGSLYSFSKDYTPSGVDRHRYISLYLGCSGLIDLTRNMALEFTVAPAMVNQVSFPAALVKIEQTDFGFYTRASLKVPELTAAPNLPALSP